METHEKKRWNTLRQALGSAFLLRLRTRLLMTLPTLCARATRYGPRVGGRALGAGSSVVRIVDWDLRRGENRFRTQAAKEEVMEEIGRYKEQYINDNSETMQALRALMRWDPNDTREIRFPDRNWFNRNPQTKLRTWQEYAGRNAGLSRALCSSRSS